MAEKSNTPPPTPRPKTSADNRDEYKPKHTRETNPYGVAIPAQLDEDVTGKYEGVELEKMRAKRQTDVRVAILEKKNDANEKQSAEWRLMYVGLLEKIAERAAQRDDVTFNTQNNIFELEAQDRIAARKARRKLIAGVATLAAPTGAVVYELIRHWWL